MITITVEDQDGGRQDHIFDKSSVMIGRSAGNDICLDIDGVSRYHARIGLEGQQLVLEDLQSTNGTFLGRKKIERVELSGDEVISVGKARLRAVYHGVSIGEDADLETEESEQGSKSKSKDEFYWQSLESFLGPIWQYISDDKVSEVMINGPEEIYVEAKGELRSVPERFSEQALKAAVLNIAQYVGRNVSEQEPYLDARLPDGSRVAVLLPPCSRKGISLSIRKFSSEQLTIDKLRSFGSLSEQMVTYLEACVFLKKNIIISGGTSSGKTSLLNVISSFIPSEERIITIEDAAELQLMQEHVLPMETRPADKKGRGLVTIRDLVRASLRMRPDRIVVGEIRGGEALDLLQAMNTGHSGSLATVHASSPGQALTRLETLALFSGVEIPMRAIREQVSSAVDVVVQAMRLPDHSRKVTHISEVSSLAEDGTYQIRDIFRFVRKSSATAKVDGVHELVSDVSSMDEEMDLAGLKLARELFSGDSRDI